MRETGMEIGDLPVTINSLQTDRHMAIRSAKKFSTGQPLQENAAARLVGRI
ncbi:hypothetical protein [Breoghania sp. L-A4]|uniref:hypothetical protein n=1 Tax=Breoghania sp. L-A4 TaxID=2304600 RepID=UPI0013C2EAED|nr:hypothetical protein [Breoghania sp. L-A4]